MTLNQALAIVKSRRSGSGKASRVYFLACGFEPLHLKTLLEACLLECLPGEGVEIRNGIYGDLVGNLNLAADSAATGAAVIAEWSDIDPRLGLRSSGGWSAEAKADIVLSCRRRCSQLETALEKLAARMPTAVAPPALPLVPIGNTIPAQSSVLELELEEQMASFLLRIARIPGIRVVSRAQPEPTPSVERLDARMELLSGFPYTLPFAGTLARLLSNVLCQPVPKKGLITDLDDTLWAGIVGEVGTDGISWDQEHHTQAHGLYQQMLGHLAACGVLLAVASRNELSTVEAALARKDLFFAADSLFPVCAGWGPKSQSVARILGQWNVAADSVVFVDDNPMDLAEVQQAFPGITCLRFRARDTGSVWNLLGELRNLFGKPVLTDEDRLRQASIRAAARIREAAAAAGSPEFLRSLEGSLTLNWSVDGSDKRPLELLNKTNQFNLNGIRIGEGEWQRLLGCPDSIVAVVSYTDKFGPLGKISVLAGLRTGAGKMRITNWVMSCRAFSRGIEHQVLASLFRHSRADEIEFAFQETERNQPVREFFRSLGMVPDPAATCAISRSAFFSRCGELPHQVLDPTND